MVTPVNPVEVKMRDGRREVLTPEVSRLVVWHEWVRDHPELFRACPEADTKTRTRHRQMLEATRKTLERGRPSARTAGRSDMYGLAPRRVLPPRRRTTRAVLPPRKGTRRVLPR